MGECFACSTRTGLVTIKRNGRRLDACRKHQSFAAKVCATQGETDDGPQTARARGLEPRSNSRPRPVPPLWRGPLTRSKFIKVAAQVVARVVNQRRNEPLPEEVGDAVQTLHGLTFMLKRKELDGEGLVEFNTAAARLGRWLQEGV